MIPKVIHYCWFGGKPLPKSALKCIASWRKYFPDYEIKEWNENNFNVNVISYTKEAYQAKKYAFVSDYARFWILYNYGGVYFDTDVKVIRSFYDIIDKGPFMGREAGSFLRSFSNRHGVGLAVAPGLGLAANPGMHIYKEFLDAYEKFSFKATDGSLNTKTIVCYTSEILLRYGLNDNNSEPQLVEGIWIYPPDYFCPMDHTKGCVLKITERTRSIHLYNASWTNQNPIIMLGRYVKKIIRFFYYRFFSKEY